MPCLMVQPPPGGFLPSGMILGSVYSPPTSNNYATITGWGADPAYPGSVTAGDGVVAQGSKPGATVAASCLILNNYLFGSYTAAIRLLVNGTLAVTGTQVSVPANGGTNTATASTTMDIVAGDILTVQVTVASSSNLSVQPTSSWARIT